MSDVAIGAAAASETDEGVFVAKGLDCKSAKEQVEQVLGRAAGLYALHLLGSEGDDNYPGMKKLLSQMNCLLYII